MNVPPFELRQLRYFAALAEELHFSRAAQRVYISQPALSQQIGRLETALGARLFERDKHRVQLTPAGRMFLEGAMRTLAAAEEAAREVAAFGQDAGATARLRVGYREYAFSSVVLPAFTRVLAANPRARLDRVDLGVGQLIPTLLEGTIDLGVGLLPFEHPEVESTRVVTGHWVAVLPPRHRLTRRRALRPSDLDGERLILFQRALNPGIHDELRRGLREAGVKTRTVYETAQVQLGPPLAAEGMGIFLVASYALPAAPHGVAVRPVHGLHPALAVGACWRVGDRNPLLDPFRRALRAKTKMAARV